MIYFYIRDAPGVVKVHANVHAAHPDGAQRANTVGWPSTQHSLTSVSSCVVAVPLAAANGVEGGGATASSSWT